MAEFSFIHSSDLHLGKKFKSFPDEDTNTRSKLRTARTNIIKNLEAVAEKNKVSHIFLAGDTFDTETPADQIIKQTIDKMKENSSIHWWVISGNHDSLEAEILWDNFKNKSEDFNNIHLLKVKEETKVEEGVYLYPCSLKNRFTLDDPTNWIQNKVDTNIIRIGLAHGSVKDFSQGGEGRDIINPQRAILSGLDYLALGDWHGHLEVNKKTFYSGSPEYDNFRHSGYGLCKKITINLGSKELFSENIKIGEMNWQRLDLSINPEKDVNDLVDEINLKIQNDRENTLVQLNFEGRILLKNRSSLLRKINEVKDSFCFFEINHKKLLTVYEPDNIDSISSSGALRDAAEMLYNSIKDNNIAQEDRDISSSALNRLYTDKEMMNDN